MSLWSKPHSISDNFCYPNLLGRNGRGEGKAVAFEISHSYSKEREGPWTSRSNLIWWSGWCLFLCLNLCLLKRREQPLTYRSTLTWRSGWCRREGCTLRGSSQSSPTTGLSSSTAGGGVRGWEESEFQFFFCKFSFFLILEKPEEGKIYTYLPKFVVRLCSFYEHELTLLLKGPFRGILLSEQTQWQ